MRNNGVTWVEMSLGTIVWFVVLVILAIEVRFVFALAWSIWGKAGQ
jgi:hypothetical protein